MLKNRRNIILDKLRSDFIFASMFVYRQRIVLSGKNLDCPVCSPVLCCSCPEWSCVFAVCLWVAYTQILLRQHTRKHGVENGVFTRYDKVRRAATSLYSVLDHLRSRRAFKQLHTVPRKTHNTHKRQDTTRHDTTRHDTTRHDTTRHDATHTTPHHTTPHHTTPHHTTPQHNTTPAKG
jgi:hypothetical protein